ncbi:MAG: hypothetical protein EBX37_14645, partial [Alphaproteobacteria bacterium]|nr:hypothetical protein [Alphaproteobacteria bacterium]
MKHSAIALFLLLAAGMASPAMAWHGNGYGHGWGNNGWGPPGHMRRVNVQQVYVQPNYYQPANYNYQQATVVNCNRQVNPITGIIGGALGGIAGNGIGKGHGRTAAIITGAVLGSAVGGVAGAQVNCTEQVVVQPGPQPVYQDVAWRNDADWNETDGRYCREYQSISTVAGRKQQTYGTACMQPDGSWE